METILSYIFVFVVAVLVLKTINKSPKVIYYSSKKIYINESFRILFLFVVTSMVGYASNILLWGIYILTIFLINYKCKKIFRLNMSFYFLCFIGWTIFTLSFSEGIYKGILMIIKLIMPLFFYILTRKAIQNTDQVWFFFEKISSSIYIYVLVGIYSAFIGLYMTVFKYYSMPVSIILIALYFKKHQRKYLLLSVLNFCVPLIMLKRTPLLGIGVGLLIFLIYRYKLKAIIPSVIGLIIGIITLINIPQLRERIFFNGEDLTTRDLFNPETFNQINTSGRDVMWLYAYENYYEPNPIIGCGIGTLKNYMDSPQNPLRTSFTLLHNDWLHILCETGLVGIILLVLFFCSVFGKAYKYSLYKYPNDLRLISCCAAGVFTTTIIHMYFENSVNSIIFFMPGIFAAILDVSIKEYRNKLKYASIGKNHLRID